MLEAQLMHECHATICNEADERVLRNEVDGLLEGVLEFTQFFRVDGGINEKKEDGLLRSGLSSRRWNDVLDCCEIRHQLSWQLLFTDVLGVVLGEVVLVCA